MRRRRRARVADLERDLAAAGAEAAITRRENQTLTDVISELAVGIVVLDKDATVLVESASAASPTPDAGINALVRDAALNVATVALDSGEVAERQLDLHGPPPYVFDITARPLGAGDGVVCTVTDVSELRRLADIRRDFTINASHELRTPIGAIALLAETLEQEEDATNIKTLAAHLVREAERAHTLIEGVLDLARFETGPPHQRAEVNLAWVARQAVERLGPLATSANVGLNLEASESVSIRGDAEQLVSAVTNLIDNAIKYSTRGDRVDVSVGRDSNWATVEVADHGVGIPSRDLDRIFERFYRVDRGRDRRTGGTGLGLAIVRHIADNHGGQVKVESAEGQGSKFCLLFPVPA